MLHRRLINMFPTNNSLLLVSVYVCVCVLMAKKHGLAYITHSRSYRISLFLFPFLCCCLVDCYLLYVCVCVFTKNRLSLIDDGENANSLSTNRATLQLCLLKVVCSVGFFYILLLLLLPLLLYLYVLLPWWVIYIHTKIIPITLPPHCSMLRFRTRMATVALCAILFKC